jgi:GSCFA family protein
MAERIHTADESETADGGRLGALTAKRRRESYWWGANRWHQDSGVVRYPEDRHAFARALPRLIRDQILPGHLPPEPLLGADDSVVTMGSCFAEELRDHLTSRGFASGNFWIPSGLNNTFAILDFISWCVTGNDTGAGFRYDRFDDGQIRRWLPDDKRDRYEQRLREAGAFVFTFGLAEVWQDRETGGVFWRGIPEKIFDADRHVFRLTTVEENEQNILRIVELIRSVNESAPIVLTLSPVPLMATFRGQSCVTADAVSKSVLRVAIDLVESRKLPNVWYWPSFEVVRWAGGHLPWPAYGIPDRRARHVTRYLVAEIIDAFVEAFYTPAAVARLRAQSTGERAVDPGSLRGRLEDAAWPLTTRAEEVLLRARGRISSTRKVVRRRTKGLRRKLAT